MNSCESLLGFVSVQSRATAEDKIGIAKSGSYDDSAFCGKKLNIFSKSRMVF